MKKLLFLFVLLSFLFLSCEKKDHFKEGIKLFDEEQYEDALDEFERVHSDSRRYDEAQDYIELCELYMNSEILF